MCEEMSAREQEEGEPLSKAILRVENAILACPDLQIVPPTTDEELSRAAALFQVKSTAGRGIFDGCVIVAVDGIFIKTNKPSKRRLCRSRVTVFYSGHKKHMGLCGFTTSEDHAQQEAAMRLLQRRWMTTRTGRSGDRQCF
jgi:hypothetical protein